MLANAVQCFQMILGVTTHTHTCTHATPFSTPVFSPTQDKGRYPINGDPSHMHSSIVVAPTEVRHQEYVRLPGVAPLGTSMWQKRI